MKLISYKSKFVIGTWPLSGDYGTFSKKNVLDTIILALENEIFEFDTAPNYGNGIIEKIIGDEVKDKILINTKVGSLENKKKSFKPEDLKSSFLRSLDRIKREKVNVLFIHNPRISDNKLLKINDYFREINKEKFFTYLGVSLPSNHQFLNSTLNKFDVIQDDFNLLKPLMNYDKSNSAFYARSVLASGLLTEKNIKGKDFNNHKDHRSLWLKGDRLKFLNKQVKLISKLTDLPIENLSRRFVLQQKKINKVIFGVRNKSQLKNMIHDMKFEPLDNKLIKNILEIYNNFMKNNELRY